jgi:hypothetical protein
MCFDMSDTNTTRRDSRVQIPPFPNGGAYLILEVFHDSIG